MCNITMSKVQAGSSVRSESTKSNTQMQYRISSVFHNTPPTKPQLMTIYFIAISHDETGHRNLNGQY